MKWLPPPSVPRFIRSSFDGHMFERIPLFAVYSSNPSQFCVVLCDSPSPTGIRSFSFSWNARRNEIGELPLEAQAMLLKAIEEKTFRPLGAAKDESSDFQLICGTNRDLNAMVVRMATLSDGGRITVDIVADEIARSSCSSAEQGTPAGTASEAELACLLGKNYAKRFDEFDLVQFAHVASVCRSSSSAADAAKKLFAVSRKAKKSNNDSDRLAKYLARFGLKFKDLPNIGK